MATRVRAHDQRDLRDDAGGVHVAGEDLAVQSERDDTLLDASACALVDANDRAPRLDREIHDLDNLFAVDLTEAAAEDRKVLAEHAHLTTVHRAVAGDDAVAERTILVQPECRASVAGEGVELDEGTFVE